MSDTQRPTIWPAQQDPTALFRSPGLNDTIEFPVLLPVCASLLRRSVFSRVGLFNEELNAVEDWEYWIRCAFTDACFHFVDLSGTNSFIRMHNLSMTQNKERMILAEFRMRMFFHKLLSAGEVRNFNFTHLVLYNSVLKNEGRAV